MVADKKFLINYYQGFNCLSQEEIEEIIENYEFIEIDKNHLLQRDGKTSKYTYLVAKGILIDYTYDQDGNMVVLSFISERHWAGGDSNYNIEGIYTKSLEPCTLFRIKSSVLEALYEKNEKVAFLEVKLLRNALKTMKLRMFNSISKPAVYNYKQLLIKFPDIEQRVSQKHIASFLGITPQFFSTMRTDFLKNQ